MQAGRPMMWGDLFFGCSGAQLDWAAAQQDHEFDSEAPDNEAPTP